MRARVMVAVVVLSLLAACSTSSKPAARRHPLRPPPRKVAYTSQKQLVADIDNSGLTPQRAELYFSLMFGPLPGVSTRHRPGTRATAPRPPPTSSVEWSLSSAQRKAGGRARARPLPASSSPPPSLAAFLASGSGSTTTAPGGRHDDDGRRHDLDHRRRRDVDHGTRVDHEHRAHGHDRLGSPWRASDLRAHGGDSGLHRLGVRERSRGGHAVGGLPAPAPPDPGGGGASTTTPGQAFPTPRPTSTANRGTRTPPCAGPTGATSPCSIRAPRCRRSPVT